MGKKGKKGKGGADADAIVTTRAMLVERERCMCPRLGDAIERRERANEIKRECVQARIKKVGEFKRDLRPLFKTLFKPTHAPLLFRTH